MKTWYKVVCDSCGEAIDLFVSNPSCTAHYLKEYDEQIQAWLSNHYACRLRLICRDEALDDLWLCGYGTKTNGIQHFRDENVKCPPRLPLIAENGIKVGELKKWLDGFSDDGEVWIGDGRTSNQVKTLCRLNGASGSIILQST